MEKSWGKMSAEDIEAAKAAPAMKAVEIIRKYGPAWEGAGDEH